MLILYLFHLIFGVHMWGNPTDMLRRWWLRLHLKKSHPLFGSAGGPMGLCRRSDGSWWIWGPWFWQPRQLWPPQTMILGKSGFREASPLAKHQKLKVKLMAAFGPRLSSSISGRCLVLTTQFFCLPTSWHLNPSPYHSGSWKVVKVCKGSVLPGINWLTINWRWPEAWT